MRVACRSAKSVLMMAVLLGLCFVPMMSWGEVAEWTLVTEIDEFSFCMSRFDESTIAISVQDGFYALDIATWRTDMVVTSGMGLTRPTFVWGPRDLWATASIAEGGFAPIWRRDSDSGVWAPYHPIDVTGGNILSVYPLWIDRNGDPWAGVDWSIQMFDGSQWQHVMGDIEFWIKCDMISEGPDGNVWIGSQYGVFSWSYERLFVNLYTEANTGFPLKCPMFGFWDSRGLYWIDGGPDLIVVWEGRGYSLLPFVSEYSSTFFSIDEDSQGNIWLGTFDGKGLIVIRPNGEVLHLPAPDGHGYGMYTYFEVICADDGFTYIRALGDTHDRADIWAVSLNDTLP